MNKRRLMVVVEVVACVGEGRRAGGGGGGDDDVADDSRTHVSIQIRNDQATNWGCQTSGEIRLRDVCVALDLVLMFRRQNCYEEYGSDMK